MQPAKSGFITGTLLSIITIFSNGNGMCLFPAILFSFLLQKRKKKLFWFAGVAGIAVVCYFLNLNWESNNEHRLDAIITSFFHFLGGNLWIPSVKIVAFLWGLFIFATYVWAVIGGFYKRNIAWFTFFTFMLLTAAMVSLNRPAGEIAPLRYRIYCCMSTILTIMFYYENRDTLHLTRWFKFLMPPIMLFNIFCSMLYLDRCEKFSEYKKVTAYNWQRDKSGLCPNNANMEEILQRAEDMSIYTMPKLPLKELASTVSVNEQNRPNLNSRILYNIDFIEETNEYVLIKGWAYTDEMGMDFTDISLWLFNDKQNIKIHPYAERRYELPSVSITVRENCGFFAVIPKAILPQGSYSLGIEIQKRYILPIKKSAKFIKTNIYHTVIAPNF
jgi:hypothetical protein